MTIEIVPVPCLKDNFAYLLREEEAPGGPVTAVVDLPEAGPVLAALDERGWGLDQAWITHHHPDHVDGLAEIRTHHAPTVIGNAHDAARLPALERPVSPGDTLALGAAQAAVIDVSGHTIGHVAFHVPAAHDGRGALLSADSLMAMGCGRLFEGTPEMMWESLGRLAPLPDEVVIYSGHDYMEVNLAFALTIEPENGALIERAERDARRRAEGRSMEHPTMGLERATNPMLRAGTRELKAAIGMGDAPDAAVFAEVRRRRDGF